MSTVKSPRILALDGGVPDLACARDGTLWASVGSRTPGGTGVLVLGPDLELRQRITTGGFGPLRLAADGAWVVDGSRSLVRLSATGGVVERLPLTALAGMVRSFVLLPDGFLLLLTSGEQSVSVARLDRNARRVWATDLPDEWSAGSRMARSWEPLEPEPLLVSGDRVLVAFVGESGGFGTVRVLDLGSGRPVWRIPTTPLESAIIGGEGSFVVGSQGYSTSELVHYGRDGRVLARWPRHGAVAVGRGGDLRGFEQENTATRQTAVRYLPEGKLVEGDPVSGYFTSPASLTASGWAIAWRLGEGLLAADPALKVRRLFPDPALVDWAASSAVAVGPDGTLVVALRDIGGGGFRLLAVPSDLGPLASGPWSRGGGNASNNPVWRPKGWLAS